MACKVSRSVLPRFASLVAEILQATAAASITAQGRAELQAIIRGFSSHQRPSTLPRDGMQLSDFLAKPGLSSGVHDPHPVGARQASLPTIQALASCGHCLSLTALDRMVAPRSNHQAGACT